MAASEPSDDPDDLRDDLRDDPRDNPVWHALRGRQRHLAEAEPASPVVRFDRDVNIFHAVDRLDDEAWKHLAERVGPGGAAILMRAEIPQPPPGWREEQRYPLVQLLAGELPEPADVPIERLGPDDREEMLALARLTVPGPFQLGTPRLGSYVGVRQAGRLVAMAGERLKLPGWTEISAVCTHPDAQRQGLGAALTLWMARFIRAAGDDAYLHVMIENESALRLYQALGFEIRRSIDVAVLIYGEPESEPDPESPERS